LHKETAGVVLPGATRVFAFSSPWSKPKKTKERVSSSTERPNDDEGDEVWVDLVDEDKERTRKAEISRELGSLFASKMQMDLMLGCGLEMQGGSSVKSKHVRIHHTVSKD
jgi:hypothetical protein